MLQPDGSFYVLLQLETDKRDLEMVETLIKDFGIAVMPGSMFGVTDGCSLRVAYGALDAQRIAEGMGRLTRSLATLV